MQMNVSLYVREEQNFSLSRVQYYIRRRLLRAYIGGIICVLSHKLLHSSTKGPGNAQICDVYEWLPPIMNTTTMSLRENNGLSWALVDTNSHWEWLVYMYYLCPEFCYRRCELYECLIIRTWQLNSSAVSWAIFLNRSLLRLHNKSIINLKKMILCTQ